MPKPTALKLLEGNPGKRALDLSSGINPRVEIPSPPKHLSKEALREWKRITPLLEELGLISGLDRTALGMLCQAQGRLYELEMAFAARVKLLVDTKGIDYVEAVYEVSRSVTPSGYEQQSVLSQQIRAARQEVSRYIAHFGLSPALRARVQASNYVDPTMTLPGIEEKPSGFAAFRVV